MKLAGPVAPRKTKRSSAPTTPKAAVSVEGTSSRPPITVKAASPARAHRLGETTGPGWASWHAAAGPSATARRPRSGCLRTRSVGGAPMLIGVARRTGLETRCPGQALLERAPLQLGDAAGGEGLRGAQQEQQPAGRRKRCAAAGHSIDQGHLLAFAAAVARGPWSCRSGHEGRCQVENSLSTRARQTNGARTARLQSAFGRYGGCNG
jgi:hypothetical protein